MDQRITTRGSLHARTLALLLLGLGIAGATGCYQRVVKAGPDYSGEIYESNLPDDTDGFWMEVSGANRGGPLQPDTTSRPATPKGMHSTMN